MTVTLPASGHHRAAAQAEHIARLFAEGHDLTTVAQQGAVNGWTRQRALQVIEQRGWQLDASGRVPRAQRPAVTPGKPLPSAPAGMPGMGTIGGERPVVAEPKPSPGRAQIAVLAVEEVRAASGKALAQATERAIAEMVADATTPSLPALTAMATAAQQREQIARMFAAGTVPPQEARDTLGLPGADALLARADTSDSARAAAAARAARACLEELRRILDADEQQARLRARLSELDAERAAILAQLEEVGTRPPEQPAPTAPPATAAHAGPTPAGPGTRKAAMAAGEIEHGTWGGFLKHRYRGETAEQIRDGCPDCYATKAGRGRKATP